MLCNLKHFEAIAMTNPSFVVLQLIDSVPPMWLDTSLPYDDQIKSINGCLQSELGQSARFMSIEAAETFRKTRFSTRERHKLKSVSVEIDPNKGYVIKYVLPLNTPWLI